MSPWVKSGDDDEDGGWPPPDRGLHGSEFSLSLQRGLAILTAFTPERPALGIHDLELKLGMNKSTIHRYTSTLAQLGYLQQDTKRKYRLTLTVTRLGLSTLSSTSLPEHAAPYMQDLANGCGYTIGLAVLDGPEVLYLHRAINTRNRQGPDGLNPEPGTYLPIHGTATGKLLLAYLPEKERAKLLRELTLTRHTPNTITRTQALREATHTIRDDGLATDDQECAPGLHAIAVPIRTANSEVIAALSMSAPTTTITLTSLIEHLTPHLIATAGRISARLGYRLNHPPGNVAHATV